MSLAGPYVHRIDPIFGTLLGVHLWWYGLAYTVGFLCAHAFIRGGREELGLSWRAAYDLTLLLAGGVLLGGRLVEVAFYEWPFYRDHLRLIPAVWLGGMSTHGLLFGGLFGVWLFCRLRRRPFLEVTDRLAIAAALILALGRIGNFIDGQIVGDVTAVPWGVRFPDAEGFRHPVVLYDGAKNLLLVPLLAIVARRRPPTGFLTGLFLFLYAFLRIFVDVFREYPTSLLGLATGQLLNLLMSALGIGLVIHALFRLRRKAAGSANPLPESPSRPWQRVSFVLLLLFPLIIPSDWTQDVPARYGKRHPGLTHSLLYPRLGVPQAGGEPGAQPVPAADSVPPVR
jgi:phosphatidylglycerol:prolipoprotein diacylglycerol transferase